MKNTKRIARMTIETERTLVYRTRSSTEARWCARCAAEVAVAEVAAQGCRMTIHQSMEACALHFAEDKDGRVFVCLNSLLREAGLSDG